MASDPMSLTGMARTIPSASGTGMRPNAETAATGAVPGSQPEISQTAVAAGSNASKLDARQRDGSGAVKASDRETVEKLTEAVDKINEMMQNGKQTLTFQLDEESERMVIRVMDAQTKEVVRQIPSEETLKFAKYVDGLVGLIFNKKA